MPFINGKRVSNEEWIEYHSGPAVDWKQAVGYATEEQATPAPEEPAPAADAPKKRTRGKRAEVKSVVADVTGLDITLAGDEEDDDAE